jgi:Ca2+-transporting ATPase
VPEVLPFLLTSGIRIPPALTVRQILAIDMGTDILPALALGIEKPEPDIMQRPPRRRYQRLVDRGLILRSFFWLGLIEAGLCYLSYLVVYLFSGNASLLNLPFLNGMNLPVLFHLQENVPAVARTVFLTGVVTAQIGNAFACRTSKARNVQMGWVTNATLLAGVALSLLMILGMIYIPQLAGAFDNQVFPSILWGGLILYPFILYTLEWFRKGAARRMEKFQEIRSSGSGERR